MADVAVFDRRGVPRATVTRDGAVYTAVLDGIDGLAPARLVSAEELSLGITSLNPPTVTAQSAAELVELAMLAVGEAVDATDRDSEPKELLMIRLRTSMAVNGALRALGEAV